MGFRSDFIYGYEEVEEDKVYFQHFIHGELVYFLADSLGVNIKVSKRGEHSFTYFTLLDKEMTFNELKDKLEEYYDTRDLMILKENMKDFIARIRREENGKD